MGRKERPEPLILYDCRHRRIPIRLNRVFANRNKLLGVCTRLEVAQNKLALQYGEPQCMDCDIAAIRETIEKARVAVLRSMPFMLCQCTTRECQTCGGKGWLSVKEFHATIPYQRWRH